MSEGRWWCDSNARCGGNEQGKVHAPDKDRTKDAECPKQKETSKALGYIWRVWRCVEV